MKSAAIVVILFSSLGTANAAEFYLEDGSVVIGSIISLEDGENLIVDTAHMDEVIIEWSSVTQVNNTEVVDIEMFDGRRFAGKLRRDGAEIALEGVSTVQLAANQIYRIEEYNESFWEGFSANTDLGMNLVRGNNQVTQLSFGAGIGYDSQNFETSLRGSAIINEQTNTSDTRRSTLIGSYTHKFRDGWQAIGSLQFEADEQQDLDGRTLLTGAIGKRVYNQSRHRLEIFTGLAVNSEKFSGLARNETLEGLLGLRYRMRTFADVDTTLVALPSLEGNDRLRTQFDAAVSFDLYSDLDFKITVYDRYDSQPPEGNDKNDTGLTLGLSWSY